MAHDFEKLMSSAKQAYPLPQGVTLNHQPQQENKLQEQSQRHPGGPAGAQPVAQKRIIV
jgi:hypothetical protein